jgi:NADH-quinone oxidoreductase subunit L
MRYAIIAAGEGSRLQQEGIESPKPLVNVHGEHLIDRLLRIFMANDAEEIVVICNDLTTLVSAHLVDIQQNGLQGRPIPLRFLVKSTPSSMHSFFELSRYLEDSDAFVLTTVDTIFREEEFGSYVSATGEAYHIHLDWSVAATSIGIALIAIGLATWIYSGARQPIADKLQATFPRLHRWAYKRFYLDEVYQFVTHRIIFGCISRPFAWFDRHVVDGFFNGLAWGTHASSNGLKTLQSGRVQQYAFVFLVGSLLLILMLIL